MFKGMNKELTTEDSLFSIRQNRMKPISKQRHPHIHFREVDRLMAPLRSPHPSPHHLSPHFMESHRSDVRTKRRENSTLRIHPLDNGDNPISPNKNASKAEQIDYEEIFHISKHTDEEILKILGDLSIN